MPAAGLPGVLADGAQLGPVWGLAGLWEPVRGLLPVAWVLSSPELEASEPELEVFEPELAVFEPGPAAFEPELAAFVLGLEAFVLGPEVSGPGPEPGKLPLASLPVYAGWGAVSAINPRRF